MKFKKLSKNASSPSKSTNRSAGWDLSSAEKITVRPKSSNLIKTDLAIKLPKGTFGKLESRSKLYRKHSISVQAGVIDEDFRGNIKFFLKNDSDKPFEISPGDRIAQLICIKINQNDAIEIGESEDFSSDDENENFRNEKGC